jgi:hypothetical protein
MSEMIERAALALFKKTEHLDPTDNGNPDVEDWGWSAMTERDRDFYRFGAEAVIEAMREPTEPMIEAGTVAMFDYERSDDGDVAGCKAHWRAMIDAALSKPVGGG